MTKQTILETSEVSTLERLIEEATRSTKEGVRRFVEPASGTLVRATSRQHHLVFGRRGSGKSSLLRKAAADLTVDRRPIAFVDLETFKGHTYPDVLLSVLIKTFSEFAEWLETAAIAPANKNSYWSRWFGMRPTRPAFDKAESKATVRRSANIGGGTERPSVHRRRCTRRSETVKQSDREAGHQGRDIGRSRWRKAGPDG